MSREIVSITTIENKFTIQENIEMADNLDFIYSQIKNLRKKLKEANSEADLQAVYGIGYKLI